MIFLKFHTMAGASSVPTALILGHSFVKRLQRDLRAGFDPRASRDFKLLGTASVCLHGVGGGTVHALMEKNVHVVRDLAPNIVILEMGTYDLSHAPPDVVGSAIDDLVSLLLNDYSVRVIGVCLVIPCGISFPHATFFLQQATILNEYVSVVLDHYPNVFFWSHDKFNSRFKDFFKPDGVHVNPLGQYFLYRSYRGAVLKATRLLKDS